jgi:hypothetical protein
MKGQGYDFGKTDGACSLVALCHHFGPLCFLTRVSRDSGEHGCPVACHARDVSSDNDLYMTTRKLRVEGTHSNERLRVIECARGNICKTGSQ